MTGTANVTIQITQIELLSLRRLQEHWPDLSIMLEAGVFSFKNGKAVIHRDNEGTIRKIDV